MFKYLLKFFLGLIILVISILGISVLVAYSKLPSVDALANCQPRMDDLNEKWINEFGDKYTTCTKIEDFPNHLKNAVIAAEDGDFYQHSGVNIIGIVRVMLDNMAGKPIAGTSTISQQISWNINLPKKNKSSGQRFLDKKLLAYKIEQNFSKNEILTFYLNQVYIGRNTYGFPIASQVYFGKNVSELTIAESAMLASLPRGPSTFDPVNNSKRARDRQMFILENMKNMGFINETQYNQAKDEILVYQITKLEDTYLNSN